MSSNDKSEDNSSSIEEKLSNLKEFTVDNEKILLPLYDIELQEKLDSNMANGVCW